MRLLSAEKSNTAASVQLVLPSYPERVASSAIESHSAYWSFKTHFGCALRYVNENMPRPIPRLRLPSIRGDLSEMTSTPGLARIGCMSSVCSSPSTFTQLRVYTKFEGHA